MAMKQNRATCSRLPLRSKWGNVPASSTQLESPRIKVSTSWDSMAAASVPETDVVMVVPFGDKKLTQA